MRRALFVAAFAVAAFAPVVTGTARTADLAGGLYLALAATGLAFAVGIGGLPLLAQGAFVGCGAVTGAHLVAAGVPTIVAAPAGAVIGGVAAVALALLVVRLPPAGVAAATWIAAWLVSIALQSVSWFLGGGEGLVVDAGPSPAQHYELALGLLALAALGYAALARAPLGLRLAAARDREPQARALGIPVERSRVLAFGLAGTVAGLAGALGVELAAVGDATQYGPFLSFKLFVAVLIGGAAAPLGAAAGVVVLGVLSIAADAIGSLEHVAASRAHELLAAVMLLGVLSLGWQGILRPARKRWRGRSTEPLPELARKSLVARGLTKRYGGVVALEDVSLTLDPGTVTAVIGPNGSGKTTLLRLLAGAIEPDSGTIDHGGVARTLQATAVFASLTPLEHLLAASSGRRLYGSFARSLFSTPKARAEEALFAADALATLDRFRLPHDVPAAELPVSEQRILMLVAAAATGAPALLVDEPAAGASHADGDRIAAALTALKEDGRAILVVEHNVALVRRIADHVLAFGVVLALAALLAGCGGNKATTKHLVVVVNAPFSSTPYLGRAIENGARLAAVQVNASGLNIKGTHYDLTVHAMDDALSPARAVANVRQAVADGAIAIVGDGTGTNASWQIAARHGVPICIVFDGGTSLVDAKTRPNVFRIAPTDHGVAFRLAEYVIPKKLKVAILHDDSDYGVNGEAELKKAFAANRSSVAIDETVPADALDLSPEVLRARRAHATAMLVWGRPATIAAAIDAARSSGWQVPFYAPPAGADPFVRQQLANHPSWVDGLTFAGGRLTAEVGSGPFESFEQKYEQAYGVDKVGVKTRSGQEVIQPPETPMYAYDFVNLLAAAITRAASIDPGKVTAALDEVTTEGANGDERSFNAVDHDGVVDDDVYFARFHDMTYGPVKDDPLSSTLPTIPQTR